MRQDFKKFIKAVGTGPKGNRDLAFEESKQAMSMILSGELTDTQISAFLIGWRLKPETVEEFRGAFEAIQEKTNKSESKNHLINYELGYPFDGKNDTPYLFPLMARILKDFEVHLIVCSDERIPSKDGVTVKQLLEKIGEVENLSHFDRKTYLPELHRLTSLRNDLGLRTAFNTLEKFSGLLNARYGSTGVFHKPYVQKYHELFKNHLDGLCLVGSNEGGPEVYKKAKIWICRGEEREEILIDPEQFGIEITYSDEPFNLDQMIRIIQNPTVNELKMALLNVAICLFNLKKTENIEKAFINLSSKYL